LPSDSPVEQVRDAVGATAAEISSHQPLDTPPFKEKDLQQVFVDVEVGVASRRTVW
jgi:hypothetical protein